MASCVLLCPLSRSRPPGATPRSAGGRHPERAAAAAASNRRRDVRQDAIHAVLVMPRKAAGDVEAKAIRERQAGKARQVAGVAEERPAARDKRRPHDRDGPARRLQTCR
eukprot:366569-Chlamydomonas_euryale.AAC.4